MTEVKRALWLVNWPFTICPWVNGDESLSAHSKLYSSLPIQLYFFTSWFAKKDFSLNTKRKFTKTIDDNVKLRRRTRYWAKQFFLKEKNLQRMMCTCHTMSRWQHSGYSPAICEQIKVVLFWLYYRINW